MSNIYVNPTVVARRAIEELSNNCIMGNNVFRGYEDEFKRLHNGWKQGSSVTIKAPLYFRVKDGATVDVVDLREEDLTFTVAYRKHVAYAVTTQDMTLSIDAFNDRITRPAMAALGNYIDHELLSMYKQVANQVGTPGTTPSQLYTLGEAKAVLTDEGVPQENRKCVLDPWATIKLADQMKGLLNAGMVDKAVTKGSFGNLLGFNMFESQNVNTHTCGTAAGLTTNLMFGATAEGATGLIIDQNGSWSNSITEGDILTVANVNSVNPMSGDSTGRLRQFVARADVDDSGNSTTLSTWPGVAPYNIYSSAATEQFLPYQTIQTLPADNAVVNIAGSASLNHKVNLAFHRDAIGLCMVPLELPDSAVWKARETHNGYSIRVYKYLDGASDTETIRFDVLFGIRVLNPFMACRIAG